MLTGLDKYVQVPIRTIATFNVTALLCQAECIKRAHIVRNFPGGVCKQSTDPFAKTTWSCGKGLHRCARQIFKV